MSHKIAKISPEMSAIITHSDIELKYPIARSETTRNATRKRGDQRANGEEEGEGRGVGEGEGGGVG